MVEFVHHCDGGGRYKSRVSIKMCDVVHVSATSQGTHPAPNTGADCSRHIYSVRCGVGSGYFWLGLGNQPTVQARLYRSRTFPPRN